MIEGEFLEKFVIYKKFFFISFHNPEILPHFTSTFDAVFFSATFLKISAFHKSKNLYLENYSGKFSNSCKRQ